jgi:glucose/mannose transport system substrate-binding protein
VSSAPAPRISRRVLLGSAVAASLSRAAAAEGRKPVEVIHWWTGGGEGAAIRVIRERFEANGFTWQDTAVEGPDLAKTAAITRVLGGKPPGVMLWFVGLDLPELYQDGVIRSIQPVAAAERWDASLPAEISRRLKVDGSYIAVPADLHRGNWTFVNNRLLEHAAVEVPTTWPEVFDACAKLQADGVIPVAFGGQPWQEAGVFVMVLAGIGGASLVRRFISEHEPAAADSPEMVESFATFRRLKPFVDKANLNRSPTDTASLVSSGKAGLYFSGDWARGDLNKAGMRPETDYTCRASPGTDGMFLAVVDAFCMPRTNDPETLAAQDAFASITMSPQVQHDFNLVKGSIPPRTDVELSGYDACAQMAAELARDGGEILPSASMGMTTSMRQAMYDVVHRFWNTDDADPKLAARDLRIAIERTRI